MVPYLAGEGPRLFEDTGKSRKSDGQALGTATALVRAGRVDWAPPVTDRVDLGIGWSGCARADRDGYTHWHYVLRVRHRLAGDAGVCWLCDVRARAPVGYRGPRVRRTDRAAARLLFRLRPGDHLLPGQRPAAAAACHHGFAGRVLAGLPDGCRNGRSGHGRADRLRSEHDRGPCLRSLRGSGLRHRRRSGPRHPGRPDAISTRDADLADRCSAKA